MGEIHVKNFPKFFVSKRKILINLSSVILLYGDILSNLSYIKVSNCDINLNENIIAYASILRQKIIYKIAHSLCYGLFVS